MKTITGSCHERKQAPEYNYVKHPYNGCMIVIHLTHVQIRKPRGDIGITNK